MFAVTCLLPSVLYLPKCAVFAQVCCICRISGKYSTLRQIQHTAAFQVYDMEIKQTFPFDHAHTKYNNAL